MGEGRKESVVRDGFLNMHKKAGSEHTILENNT